MRLLVTQLGPDSAARGPIEVVERKGLGHPDTICDALAENLSRALSQHYLERAGAILHHNVDKALLVGGVARPAFGGGEVLVPLEIHLAGRATVQAGELRFDVEGLARAATSGWLREHLRHLDVERDVRIHTHIRPTSTDLTALFARAGAAPLANDTSFGVGYAPLDTLERTVLAVERHLAGLGGLLPWVGDDVKVMGVRDGEAIALTVACAFVGRHVASVGDYLEKRAKLAARLTEVARTTSGGPTEVCVNAADGATADSLYLTVTGLSAEGGDDGQVGRGNRVNGLITPYRPMSLEAAAGKNPVTHVGKLYNVVAGLIAADVVASVPEVGEAVCTLASQIGRPIDDPHAAEIAVRLAGAEAGGSAGAARGGRGGRTLTAELEARIAPIVRGRLAGIGGLWREIVAGRHPLW